MNPWMILAVVVAFVVEGFYWDHHGHETADVEWRGKIATERVAAVTEALKTERADQEKTNEAIRKQNEKLAGINAGLEHDLVGLRNRPERKRGVPTASKTECAGGTGAELSREDAEFLTREAARADSIREALIACYEVTP